MGVPGLFAWLRKRYSSIAQMVVRDREGRWMGCSPPDNLYIDTNHLVHACAHATVARGRDRLSDEEIYERIEVRPASSVSRASSNAPSRLWQSSINS